MRVKAEEIKVGSTLLHPELSYYGKVTYVLVKGNEVSIGLATGYYNQVCAFVVNKETLLEVSK
jgi:hypothetical protein